MITSVLMTASLLVATALPARTIKPPAPAVVEEVGKRKRKRRSNRRRSTLPYAAGAYIIFNGERWYCENGAKPFVRNGKVYCPVR